MVGRSACRVCPSGEATRRPLGGAGVRACPPARRPGKGERLRPSLRLPGRSVRAGRSPAVRGAWSGGLAGSGERSCVELCVGARRVASRPGVGGGRRRRAASRERAMRSVSRRDGVEGCVGVFPRRLLLASGLRSCLSRPSFSVLLPLAPRARPACPHRSSHLAVRSPRPSFSRSGARRVRGRRGWSVRVVGKGSSGASRPPVGRPGPSHARPVSSSRSGLVPVIAPRSGPGT